MTRVKFYIEPLSGVMAVFPDMKERNGYRNDLMTCYSHVGQHSTCAPDYLSRCRRAEYHEYKDLLAELRSIGYNDLHVEEKKRRQRIY